MTTTRSPLAIAVLACHAALAAAIATLVFRAGSTPASGAVLALLAITPLLATCGGLCRPSRTRPWAAFLLVIYVGAASVEVVASSGGARLASAAFLVATLELGLLLALIRRDRAPRSASSE
jgi:uncharacterized membrane protein